MCEGELLKKTATNINILGRFCGIGAGGKSAVCIEKIKEKSYGFVR